MSIESLRTMIEETLPDMSPPGRVRDRLFTELNDYALQCIPEQVLGETGYSSIEALREDIDALASILEAEEIVAHANTEQEENAALFERWIEIERVTRDDGSYDILYNTSRGIWIRSFDSDGHMVRMTEI